MDVNLFDGTMSLNEAMKELGLTTVKTAEQVNTTRTNGFTANLSVFDKEIARLKAPRILDESVRAFGDLVRASKTGMATEEQKTEFLKGSFEQMLAMYGDGTIAFGQYLKSFDKGGTAYAAGGPLSDIKDQGFHETAAFKQFKEQSMGTMSTDVGSQLNAVLASSNQMIDQNALRTSMENMTPEQIVKMGQLAQGGFKELRDPSAEMKALIKNEGMDAAIAKITGVEGLKTERFKDVKLNMEDMADEVAAQTNVLIKKMGGIFDAQKEQKPNWYTEPPVWWSTLKTNDTSTPRGSRIGDTTSSRLSQTMGRHSAMDGMLTGKRTVTSAYRNFGLGSMNSDHVTGRAYDLTGQNLGQYQSLVKAGGGFAEYHGVNKDRHLHVVPGSGMGDSASPAPVAPNQTSRGLYPSSGGGGGGNTYQFYVSGNQNASAKEIAEIVMQKVKDTERSNRERM
jgi:hypothetical protein